jgi:hypothetical protein
MQKIIVTIIIVIVLISILTNPNHDQHCRVIKENFNSYIQQSIGKPENGFEALGLMIGNTIADQMINNIISIDNYVIFSITKMKWEEKNIAIGIGILGNVLIFKEKELNNILKK